MNKKRLIILFLLIGSFFLLIGTSSYIAYADSGWDTDYGSSGSSYSYGGGGSSYSYSYGGSSSSYSWSSSSSSSSSSSYHSSGSSKPLRIYEKVDWAFGIASFFLYAVSIACILENRVSKRGLMYLAVLVGAILFIFGICKLSYAMCLNMSEGAFTIAAILAYIILNIGAYYFLSSLEEDFPVSMLFAGYVSFFTLMADWSFAIANLVAYAISYVICKIFGSFKNKPRKHLKPWNYTDITNIELQKYIPNETVNSLKGKLFNIFYEVQMAWMEFDYEKLRDICTDELATTYIGQLNSLKAKNSKNVMNGFKVLKSNIVGIRRTDDNIKIEFYLRVKFRDFVIDNRTKRVERGFKYMKICNDYNLVFDLCENLVESKLKCPKCGAVIVPNKDGICEYCHSKIIYTNDKVILSKKGML